MPDDFFGANAESSFVFKSVHDAAWSSVAAPLGPISVATRRSPDKELTAAESYAYSVSVRRAVDSISTNVAAGKARLFTESDREVGKGPLIDRIKRPSKYVSWKKYIYDICSWWLITGEVAVRKKVGADGVDELIVLNPGRLTIEKPSEGKVDRRSDVVQWRYNWRSGKQESIPDDELIWTSMFNSFDGSIRGMSPLFTGGTQAAIYHFASRYNKTALANDCIPQGMLVLPEGTPRSQREVYEQKFFSEFGSNKHDQNYRRMMVTSGGDVEFKPFEQEYKDAWFLEAQKMSDEYIGKLYGVPPIVMHNLEKTRFDTANEELRHYHENTISPLAEMLTELHQMQLVDPHYRRSGHTTTGPEKPEKPEKMSKMLKRDIEKARAIAEGQLVFLIDMDTVPTMASVKASMIEAMGKFRDVTMYSPKATNDYFGIEADDPQNDKLREDIWAENKYINVSNPEMNAKLVPGVAGSGSGETGGNSGAKPTPKPAAGKKELTSRQKSACKKFSKLLRRLRERSLAAADANAMWAMDDADSDAAAMFGDTPRKVWHAIRTTYHGVRHFVASEDLNAESKKDALREYFNGLSTRPSIRQTLGF